MTQPPELKVISVGGTYVMDGRIIEDVESAIASRQSFVIRADNRFRGNDAIVRWLRVYKGEGDKRGFFRTVADGIIAGRITPCLGAARDARYRWSYEQTGDVLTITFEPPDESSGD